MNISLKAALASSLSELSEKISKIENQNKKIMKHLLIMEKRRKENDNELQTILKDDRKEETHEEVGKFTNNKVQVNLSAINSSKMTKYILLKFEIFKGKSHPKP